jgi:hypothetical protein
MVEVTTPTVSLRRPTVDFQRGYVTITLESAVAYLTGRLERLLKISTYP